MCTFKEKNVYDTFKDGESAFIQHRSYRYRHHCNEIFQEVEKVWVQFLVHHGPVGMYSQGAIWRPVDGKLLGGN